MTMALCLNCGDIKFGALCPCPACNCGPSDRPEIDILLSDHHFPQEVLEDFGKIIKQLQALAPDRTIRAWAFLKYMSDNYPKILYVQPAPECADEVAQVLSSLNLPRVDIESRGRTKQGLSPPPRLAPGASPSRQARALSRQEIAALVRSRLRAKQHCNGPNEKPQPNPQWHCPKCNITWPEGTNFCGKCGGQLPGAQPGLNGIQARVDAQLRELLPKLGLGTFHEIKPGHFVCIHGSTHVNVQIFDFHGQVAVRSISPVTTGSRLEPTLLQFLLGLNSSLAFGAFGIDAQGAVVFSHSILASSVDEAELGASVKSVLLTADQFDDKIVLRWGGQSVRKG